MGMKNSERCAFIGADVRPTTKRTLEVVVKSLPHPDDPRRPMSTSRFISDLLERELKRMGFGTED